MRITRDAFRSDVLELSLSDLEAIKSGKSLIDGSMIVKLQPRDTEELLDDLHEAFMLIPKAFKKYGESVAQIYKV
jgi:hypothetical protein